MLLVDLASLDALSGKLLLDDADTRPRARAAPRPDDDFNVFPQRVQEAKEAVGGKPSQVPAHEVRYRRFIDLE
jgi:voltage-gated potassium channel Kch